MCPRSQRNVDILTVLAGTTRSSQFLKTNVVVPGDPRSGPRTRPPRTKSECVRERHPNIPRVGHHVAFFFRANSDIFLDGSRPGENFGGQHSA